MMDKEFHKSANLHDDHPQRLRSKFDSKNLFIKLGPSNFQCFYCFNGLHKFSDTGTLSDSLRPWLTNQILLCILTNHKPQIEIHNATIIYDDNKEKLLSFPSTTFFFG